MIDNLKFSLGTWAMGGGDSWGECDDRDSIKTVHKALDYGVKWIDTAPAYGNGRSEELLGDALLGKRNSVFLATKCGLVWDEEGSMEHIRRDGLVVYRNLRPDSIRRQLETSLKRLKTDYIDLYITHHQNPNDNLEDTISCLEDLKKEGKILSYGLSNGSVEIINSYLKYGNPECVQEKWSALDRKKDDVLALTAEKGIIFQAYSPLERGLLAGKVSSKAEVVGTAKKRDLWYRPENVDVINARIASLFDMASSYGVGLSALVLAWQMSYTDNMCVCVGARKEFQIEENAKAIGLKISESDLKTIGDTLLSIEPVSK